MNKFNAANSVLPSDQSNTIIDELTSNKNEVKVKSITIEDFVNNESISKIDILKLDIQGGEIKALRGAEKLLSERRISMIYTEVLFMPIYKEQPYFHDIAKFLYEYGYQVYNIYNPWYAKKRLSWADALFVSPE